MAYNGSGVFSRLFSWTTDKGNSVPVTASRVDQEDDGFATGLSSCIVKDGQQTTTARIPFAQGVSSMAGTAGAVSYAQTGDLDTGMYFPAAGTAAIAADGVAQLVVSSGGVTASILTSNGALVVSGNVTLGGNITVSASANFSGLVTAGGNMAVTGTLGVTGEFTASVTANFTGIVKLTSTSHELLPSGTTGQRPGSPAAANFRYNSTLGAPEFYNGSSWVQAVGAPVPGAFKNLSIKVASNTTVTLAADFVAMTDASTYLSLAISSTINLGTTGANALDTGSIAIDTWYAIWAIAKADGTTAGLASTSDTAPTMPSGYTFKARVGKVRTIHASATLLGTWQFGRRAQYVIGLAQTTGALLVMSSGAVGTYSATSPTLAAVAVGSFVPPTASHIIVSATSAWKGGSNSNFLVAPNSSWGGSNNGAQGSNGVVWPISYDGGSVVAQTFQATMLLESTNIHAASSAAGFALSVLGWEDNI